MNDVASNKYWDNEIGKGKNTKNYPTYKKVNFQNFWKQEMHFFLMSQDHSVQKLGS